MWREILCISIIASAWLTANLCQKRHTEDRRARNSFVLLVAMAASALVLFVAVHKDDKEKSESNGFVARRYVGGCDYIGLRERPQEALERAAYLEESVSKATHLLLEWHLSSEALARYVTTCAGPEQFQVRALQESILRYLRLEGVAFPR